MGRKWDSTDMSFIIIIKSYINMIILISVYQRNKHLNRKSNVEHISLKAEQIKSLTDFTPSSVIRCQHGQQRSTDQLAQNHTEYSLDLQLILFDCKPLGERELHVKVMSHPVNTCMCNTVSAVHKRENFLSHFERFTTYVPHWTFLSLEN